jgi:hypothetical protein
MLLASLGQLPDAFSRPASQSRSVDPRMVVKYDTALREYVLQRIAEIGAADLLVGIPAYNSEETIVWVMSAAYAGLERHYPEARSVLFVSDGG